MQSNDETNQDDVDVDRLLMPPPPSCKRLKQSDHALDNNDQDSSSYSFVMSDVNMMDSSSSNKSTDDIDNPIASHVNHVHNHVNQANIGINKNESEFKSSKDDDRIDNGDIDCDLSSSGSSTNQSSSSHHHHEEEEEEEILLPTETTRFRDIIGHTQAKLRLDEALLPLALPPDLADSILKGKLYS